jgi:DNA-binding response OmpR family regulator
MKLLYAEDERAMSEAVTDILTYHKYSVDAVFDGQDALDYAHAEEYDGIILDVMMPKMSGLEVLRTLRQEGCRTPVLLLTAKAEVEDRIEGLDLGADDYLPKPFAMGELLARVRAMLRRRDTYVPDVVRVEDLTLDKGSCELSCGGSSIRLAGKLYQLMLLFMENPRQLFSVQQLMDRVWSWDAEAEINVVWVNISQLRKKLAALDTCMEIAVHRGSGYSLEKKKE